jgi:hypothetical protein
MNDYFDDLNPTFRDEEAFILGNEDLYDEDGVFIFEEGEVNEDDLDPVDLDSDDDDFPEMLEYDDWQDDMYADGEGFYSNEEPDF